MFKMGVGIGEGSDDYSVGVMAVSNAVNDLRRDRSDHTPSAVLLFISPEYNFESVIRGVRSVLGEDIKIAGTSTAGELTQQGPTIRDSVVVVIFSSDTVSFSTSVSADLHAKGSGCAELLANSIQTQHRVAPHLAILFADGFVQGIDDVLTTFESTFSVPPAIVGGSSGDGSKFTKTHQICEDEVFTNAVVAMGFGDNLTYSIGMAHGWNSVGAPQTITESHGSTIVSIEDKPAFTFYRNYLGEEEADKLKRSTLSEVALSYPMGVYDEQSGLWVLRSPIRITDDGSIETGGVFPLGAKIQLMMGSREDAIKAAHTAALTASQHMTGKVAGAIVISSYIRNTLFSEIHSSKHEIESIKSVLGNDIPIAGFYSYAEFAPLLPLSTKDNHLSAEFMNASVIVLLLGET